MTEVNLAPTNVLHGRRILIVEDDYMSAQDAAKALAKAGAETHGPVPAVADALKLVSAEQGGIDGALLDVNVRDGMIWPVVDALQAQGVPLVLVTGYDAEAIPPAYAGLPRCEKPGTPREFIRALERLLTSAEER